MARARADDQLLLGEWACLGILYQAPAHGFAVAARLRHDGDVGRVWSLSRPLTYRALEQLALRGLIRATGQEPGIAGGDRTVLAVTRTGRTRLRAWLRQPVTHGRDLRSELLVKMVLAGQCAVDISPMLDQQRAMITETADALHRQLDDDPGDVVVRWRFEASTAALRFLDGVRPRG